MSERVFITGIGIVSPIGIGVEAYASALRIGRSGARRIRAFDCDGFETRIAAEVDDDAIDPAEYVKPRKLAKLMTRACQFGVPAADMARRDARLGPEDIDTARLGVSLGTGGMGLIDMRELQGLAVAQVEAYKETGCEGLDVPAFARAYMKNTNPMTAIIGLPNLTASHVAIQQQARGPNTSVATSCAAGTQGVGEGLRMIQRGEADAVLAGGADAMITFTGLLGFTMLGTLSARNDDPERATRPFDLERDGFVIGEGAAVLMLEREEFARARGTRVLAELAGYASNNDAYRVTDERPDASGAADAMRRCIEDAKAIPADVDYVNAHGTATRLNDRLETAAIKQALGARAGDVLVSSTKSMIGHMTAAAGAAELAAAVIAMECGFAPPTINYQTPDPECDLDYVPNVARDARIDCAISNSFGFGGQNACVLVRRP